MTIQLEIYQFIMILITVLSTVIGTVKVLWGRIEKSLDQNFSATNQKLEHVSRQAEQGQNDIRRLERDFLIHQAELPNKFVAREDYIRGQTVIEAKLDAVAQKLENVQIKQGMQR
ncbi:hypothetical protein [Acinetobacter haemolyticus]|uniref:hypothetical protein n=1 Tax=Acinetobacter haemolyticus TaxID=29430 RepID=UPI000F74A335|nr:hypothetical protein [Acinetobacter haemolyticus]RSN77911.1 hypothetical protein EA769_03570 [Acinetobacter haemolyticus]